jgi:AraC family transcriptional regulator
MPLGELLAILAYVQSNLAEDLSLGALAARAGLSPFHFHRAFRRAAGETAKSYALRLRLERAAIALTARRGSVLAVALASGFQSNEAFTRAFRGRFGVTPSEYRARGLAGAGAAAGRARHAALTRNVGPCVRLYRAETKKPRRYEMAYSIATKELAAQPILFIRRRVKPAEISAALGEMLPKVYVYAQRSGFAFGGPPFSRYDRWGPGLITLEAGLPLAAPAPGEGAITAGSLYAGRVAAAIHAGPYDTLGEAHAEIERWIEAQGLSTNGAPWESYLTDPAEHPDPKDWKTEVFWPVR